MLRHNPEYRRLKVGGRGALGAASYWLGRDHLLVVIQSGYVESYRRFLFADIQAVVVQKNVGRLVWNVVFGLLALPCLISGLVAVQSAPVGAGVLFGLALLLGLLGAINSLKGPTCACYLGTAVQQAPLPQIRRWAQAQRLLQELSPHLLSTQGPLEPAPGASAPAAEARAGVAGEAPAGTPGYVVDDPGAPPRIVS